ncbi:Ale1p [Malassezia vespertilionis]|uniref:Ale1p n=1 Tax=Malassezia vespertilionis TaxID=2020962 RepID=A0A2N1JGS0_9BASI|nr:Ale1p [Malassezia vespertilionis]
MFHRTFAALSERSGVPPDFLKVTACLIFSCVLSPILPRLLSARMRHITNIGVSLFFLCGILELYNGTLQLVASALVVYLIVKYKIGGKHRFAWVAFAFEMAHILATHVARLHLPLTTIEISAMHMVLCMNITSFAWDCYDGQVLTKEECDASQRATRVTEMPPLLDYFGYCFYFPGVLVGPSTRFRDYSAWAAGTMYLPSKVPPPGRFASAARGILFGFVVLGLQAFLYESCSYARLSDLSDPIQHTPLWYRLAFVQLAGLVARFRYFSVWSLSDAACVLSGLGYAGIDPKTHKAVWTRCKNVYILRFEFANNWKELMDAWNTNTSIWLRNNVYRRVAGKGRRPGTLGTLLTFGVSALWHGIAIGYYFTFLSGGLYLLLARKLRHALRPIFYANVRTPDPDCYSWRAYTWAQILYSVVSTILVQITINFVAIRH